MCFLTCDERCVLKGSLLGMGGVGGEAMTVFCTFREVILTIASNGADWTSEQCSIVDASPMNQFDTESSQ